MGHLVLIDGHHLLYRAYWAIPRTLKTSSGEQVNTVFGFASMILSILKAEQPDYLLLCFDAGSETFRHREHEEYKEGRAETPDDFYTQIPRVHECAEVFTIPHVESTEYEADDFLAAYAKLAESSGHRVTIVTGDRDALQVATEHTRIAIPHSGYQAPEYLGPKEIEAKYGIRPDQVPDYKGLTGDSSDNLPGVKGIGPKTAAKLLQQYQTLDSLYDHLSEVALNVRSKLEHDRKSAFFCRKMAVLVRDMPLPFPLESLLIKNLPLSDIALFFQQMEFTVLLRRLRELVTTEYGKNIFDGSFAEVSVQPKKKEDTQMGMFD